MAERPGFGGWGDRSTCLYVTAAPIKRKSALGDYALSLGIGRHFAKLRPLLEAARSISSRKVGATRSTICSEHCSCLIESVAVERDFFNALKEKAPAEAGASQCPKKVLWTESDRPAHLKQSSVYVYD
jgi:hypothetical protein